MLAVMPFSHQCRKSCQYLTEFDVGTNISMISDFDLIFSRVSRFPVAILDIRVGLGLKFFRHFVDKTYRGKVTKAFPKIPGGYGAAAERSAWGVILPPPPLPHEG